MFRFVAALAAVALMGMQAAPPQLSPELAPLAEDAEAARTFDYMGLKAREPDLKRQIDAVHMRARPGADRMRRCLTEAETELQMGLTAAASADDAAAFAADRTAADEAWAKWTVFEGEVMGGRILDEQPFASVVGWVREGADSPDARLRELYRRTGRDQLLRHAFTAGDQVWGELSPGAQARVNIMLGREICGVDGENTAWLKADIAANGWYRVSTQGERADNAAWLMTQHADRDPAFQGQILALLETLLPAKDTRPSSYAYLYDRVAVGAGRPQRYATQGRCVAKDRWEPNDLEDAEQVEALRAEVEIGTLAEYQAHMHRYCADFTG